jgi:PAS domain S-box-containing protein
MMSAWWRRLRTAAGQSLWRDLPPFEVRIRDASGEYRWLEMIATNLLADPVVEGIVVNARDVTERRQSRTSSSGSTNRSSGRIPS